jgi:hypothetical protein
VRYGFPEEWKSFEESILLSEGEEKWLPFSANTCGG